MYFDLLPPSFFMNILQDFKIQSLINNVLKYRLLKQYNIYMLIRNEKKERKRGMNISQSCHNNPNKAVRKRRKKREPLKPRIKEAERNKNAEK